MALFSLFRQKPEKLAAEALYGAIVAQSRAPEFYSQMDAADTLDGRFEILVLHAGLVTNRLTMAGGRSQAVSQALFDLMFRDLDHTLREMGVGDITVPRRIKEMGEAFYGRSLAYTKALSTQDAAALTEAIGRNVYRGARPPGLPKLVAYAVALYVAIQAQVLSDLTDGRVTFPALTAFAEGGG